MRSEELVELAAERQIELPPLFSIIEVVRGDAVQNAGVVLELRDRRLQVGLVIAERAARLVQAGVGGGQIRLEVIAVAPQVAGVKRAGEQQQLRDGERDLEPALHAHTALPAHPASM